MAAVLDMFVHSVNVGGGDNNRRRDMAIECKRCGGPTMSETLIKLRRGVFGFRETRSQGGYCPTCRLSVPMEGQATMRPPIAISDRLRPGLRGFMPMRLRVAPARSGGIGWV
jgi:ssDNA-binding Zn-finger/Zn-ribbon topoisomerase 1